MTPETIDEAAIKEKWNEQKKLFFESWTTTLNELPNWSHTDIEQSFNDHIQKYALKKGDVMLPFRIMLVGAKHGPAVFMIAEVIGKGETIKRINKVLAVL